MKKFVAYDSFLTKVIIVIDQGEIDLEVKGIFSPFLKVLKKKFGDYLENSNYEIKNEKLFLSSAFPPIPSKAFERLVKNEIKRLIGINYPNSLTIMVTGRCECNCNHCLARDMMGEKNLGLSTLKNLIDQALELGVSQIVFEGGEPTLRTDLKQLINYVDERATTMVVTNGANIDDRMIKSFEEAGLDFLNFSIDSPYPSKHNEFRSKPNLFQKVKKGIKKGVESDILTGILYIANPNNCSVDELSKLVELAKSLDVFELMIDEIVDSGNWRNKEVLNEKQKNKIKSFKRNLIKNKDIKIINTFFSLREPEKFGCFAGRRWLFSSPNGEIMPCMHTPISFGNIQKKNLKNIWNKIRSNKLFKKSNKCVYEKDEYKKQYLKEMIEKEEYPYKIRED